MQHIVSICINALKHYMMRNQMQNDLDISIPIYSLF